VVNETMARRLGPGGSILGRRITRIDDGAALEVVGVVRDIPPPDPAQGTTPEIYWPFSQSPRFASFLVIRGSTTLVAVAARLAAVTPELEPPTRLLPFREAEARIMAAPRFNLSLSAGFAAVALVLAMAGIYGVMAHAVVSRRREIGVRIAVGARPSGIRLMIAGASLRLAAIGIAIGLVAAGVLGRLIRSVLIGVAPCDPLTLAAAAVALLAAALVATWLPAIRAGRTDPANLLRAE
jgi:ABC-type antimicrobial peptide transport system permease subunit